jgi:hypothetical protein
MRPELELLRICARPAPAPDDAAAVRRCLELGLDWDRLVDLTQLHGVQVLLTAAIDTHDIPAPEDFRERLDAFTRKRAGINQDLVDAIAALMPHFDGAGIQTLLFKGPEMVPGFSPSFAARPFSDVDVLVDKRDVPAAIDLLMRHGYGLKHGGAWDASQFLWYHHGETLKRPGASFEVDLHWEVMASRTFGCRFPFKKLWDRRMTTTIQGTNVSCVSLEDLFLILCIHGCKHRWTLLKWLRDIAILATLDTPPDWNVVKQRASAMGAKRMVALSLFLVGDILDTTVPEAATHAFPPDRHVRSLAKDIYTYFVAESHYGPDGRRRHSFYLRMRERQSDKTLYAMYLAKRRVDATRWTLLRPALCSLMVEAAWPLWTLAKRLRRTMVGRGERQTAAAGFNRTQRSD